ncbi:Hypothetical predicted protein [Octopus vulgaris]|uniref:Uncharacterized protein n=1 Tax=Octopus vulgaris TaxID=6645 RepID=A0AA36FBK1_OCTVU|nr:Hypothetical predicted protein [Octopus vulgaris]
MPTMTPSRRQQTRRQQPRRQQNQQQKIQNNFKPKITVYYYNAKHSKLENLKVICEHLIRKYTFIIPHCGHKHAAVEW